MPWIVNVSYCQISFMSDKDKIEDERFKPTYAKAAATIDWYALSLGKIVSLPCAAQSFSIGILVSTLTGIGSFAGTKRLGKSINYSIVAFLAGSVISWELCRFQRRIALKQLNAMSNELYPEVNSEKQ
jgi:Protein of unknown function (DUF3767)